MPGSVVTSGGGGASSTSLRAAIDSSADVDRLLILFEQNNALVAEIKALLSQEEPAQQIISPFVQQPMLVARVEEPAESPLLEAPPGVRVHLQIAAWCNSSSASAVLEIVAGDGTEYLKIPIGRGNVGFFGKTSLPLGVSAILRLSVSGGTGYLNSAVGTIKDAD